MTEVQLDWRYRREWPDGFGACGWKLASAVDDPNIIASTPATGERIPTAVFIHDILDHALCGLPPSGHRAESIALLQLAARTGADPRPDLAQMVDEDLLQGQADGELLESLLPDDLKAQQLEMHRSGRAAIESMIDRLGREAVRSRLIEHLFEIGLAGAAQAEAAYRACGLEYARRGALGLALQRLFTLADQQICEAGWDQASGLIAIVRDRCTLQVQTPQAWSAASEY
ncbi:hypothetical protein [Halochromatium roseum]|uniref:hypothetical protein n=1 Tax=Halochromatium roseum TaxID=391920 RepID=UPI0019132FBA|nr:hypothetical protein [Halochromatium roseum]MBK5938411.1 hypothetical protein [Halochromatium roseum]